MRNFMMTKLEERVLDISYKKGLSHIGSCLTSVGLIDKIYLAKKGNDKFVLANGHAGLALYVILEKFEKKDAEALFEKHGVHPNRDVENGIWVSSGSLGQALPIAVGMAIADKTRDIFVLTSDGDMAEGSNWEALRIAAELRLENLKIMVNANGYSAYKKVDSEWLDLRMQYFYPSLLMQTNLYEWPEYLQGLAGHYTVLSEDQYKELRGKV